MKIEDDKQIDVQSTPNLSFIVNNNSSKANAASKGVTPLPEAADHVGTVKLKERKQATTTQRPIEIEDLQSSPNMGQKSTAP